MKSSPKVAIPENMAAVPTDSNIEMADSLPPEKKELQKSSTVRSRSQNARLRSIARSQKTKNEKLMLRRRLLTNKYFKNLCSHLRHSNHLLKQQLQTQEGQLRVMNLISDKLDRLAASRAG